MTEKIKEEDKWKCLKCDSTEFNIQETPVDFPFFECLCAKCGSINIMKTPRT